MYQPIEGKWLLTEDDIKIREDDLEIEDEKISAYIESWFDVDQRFGTSTRNTDDYINLHAEYDPADEGLALSYFLHRILENADVCEQGIVEDFDDREKAAVLHLMKQAGLDELTKTMLRYKMEDCYMGFIREAQSRISRFNPEDVLKDSDPFNYYLTAVIEVSELKRRMIDISTDKEAPIKSVRNLLKRDDPLQAVYDKLIELYEGEIEGLGCFEADSVQCYEAFEQAAEDGYEQ